MKQNSTTEGTASGLELTETMDKLIVMSSEGASLLPSVIRCMMKNNKQIASEMLTVFETVFKAGMVFSDQKATQQENILDEVIPMGVSYENAEP